jgi:hypothetical protein
MRTGRLEGRILGCSEEGIEGRAAGEETGDPPSGYPRMLTIK